MWVTVAIAVVLLALVWALTGRPKGLPPGPKCYPIIGNIGYFKSSETLQTQRKLGKKYGDIYTLMVFQKPMIIVQGYDNIRKLLVDHGDIFSDRPLTLSSAVLNKGKGLIWSSGALWKEQRTFASTTLRKFGFGKRCLQTQIMEEVDCLMEKLEKFGSKPFDIKDTLNASVSNVICSFLFGKRFEYEDSTFKRLITLLQNLFTTTNVSSPVVIFPVLRFLPMFKVTTIRKIVNDINEFIKEKIEEHRQNFDESNINDFIDAFLLEQTKKVENSTFTDEQLIITINEFFAAGTETTSTTLRWALLFLIHHPDWQTKLQRDIDEVIGQGHPTMEHKDQLSSVEAFTLEVQRLANVTPHAPPHAPTEDFYYKGYFIPKGTFMIISLDSVMNDPNIFPEPHKFNPERFLNDRGVCGGEQKDKLLPFSAGRRVCLGESLAKMELFLFLTRFLQKFRIEPENPDCLPPLEGTLGLTNFPKSYNLILLKR
uniref:Cytochrome P450 2C14-like n=1 Tax=Crassostrea virginica TaxID=6565 RepID=A0A8B8E9Y8_CRAVI|nr:cytochrome P450 2C14-like [Crassostrea virginica]